MPYEMKAARCYPLQHNINYWEQILGSCRKGRSEGEKADPYGNEKWNDFVWFGLNPCEKEGCILYSAGSHANDAEL